MDNIDIEFLKKQFLCCTRLNKFKWPNFSNGIEKNAQNQIINATVNNEIILKYPVKQSYKKAFLKSFINKLEQNGVEIDDNVYSTYCDVIASPNEESLMHYRHFSLNCQNTSELLSIKESTNIISQGTTGLCSWKAAFYLAEWCIANKNKLDRKNILELGSGVGLTGLTVVHLCAPKAYYFSDCHPKVLKLLEENVHLNLIEKGTKLLWKEILSNNRIQYRKVNKDKDTTVKVLDLKWEEMEKVNTEELGVDVVIAADVLYDSSSFDSLATGLKVLLCKTVNYAVIAATVRNETTVLEFLNTLDKHDLLYEEETTSILQMFIECDETPIRILKISRQNK